MMAEIDGLRESLDRYAWHHLKAGHLREGMPALVATRVRKRDQSSDECATDLLRELQRHCDSYGGYQRYQVLLLDADNQHLAEYICDLGGQERPRNGQATLVTTSSTTAMVMPEDPEALRVALRLALASFGHAESAFRMLASSAAATTRALVDENARLRDHTEHLEERDRARREQDEINVEAKHRREMEIASEERNGRHKQQMIDMVSELAPVAAAVLTGAIPATKLVESLTPDQFNGLYAVMSEEQRGLLGDLLHKAKRGDLAQRVLAGQLTREQALRLSAPPEEDVNNGGSEEAA